MVEDSVKLGKPLLAYNVRFSHEKKSDKRDYNVVATDARSAITCAETVLKEDEGLESLNYRIDTVMPVLSIRGIQGGLMK